ncbi:MAG: hypothetical protein WAQ28_20540 [Bacteroidia bacterium]|jgi:hypothetical protein
MRDIPKLLLFIVQLALLTGCFNRHWSEKKRNQFKKECDATETFSSLVVLFKGFDNNEFSSITVNEFKDSVLIGSFKIDVDPATTAYDIENKNRMATITRTMNINHKYYFIIPGQAPYKLADMKMVMWAQFSMLSEGWGCVMGDYTLNGERFEHSANPVLRKIQNRH